MFEYEINLIKIEHQISSRLLHQTVPRYPTVDLRQLSRDGHSNDPSSV
jgi:hypothetical protein